MNIDIRHALNCVKYNLRNRSKKCNHKKAISYVISLILSLCIIAVFILGYINAGLLNETNVRGVLKETNYYYNIYGLVKDIANDYVMQSGFDETVLKNVITEEQVQNDINRLIDCIYNNKKVELDTENIRKKLEQNIQNQITEKNYNITEETQKDINEFENSVLEAYTTNMYYSKDTVNELSSKVHKLRNGSMVAIFILCVSIVILGYILFKINEPAIGISCIIAGIIFIIIKTYSVVNIAINNILILNWAFSRTLTYILNNLIQQIFITGIVLLIIGIISIVLSEYMKYTNEKN